MRTPALLITILSLLACTGLSTSINTGPADGPATALPVAPDAAVGSPTAAPAIDETLIDAASYLSGGRGLADDGVAGDDNRGMPFNGIPKSEWTPSAGERLDLVVQFAQPYDLATAVIVNGHDPDQAVDAMAIDIGPAADGPWTEVAKITLATGQQPQAFPLVTTGTRFARLRLVSHHGNSDYFAIDDVHLLGKRSSPENGDLTGYYLGNYGEASLTQTGTQVTGCYGIGFHLTGTVEDGVMFGSWTHVEDDGTLTTGPLVLARTAEGDLSGAVGDPSTNGTRALRWDATRQDTTTLDCNGTPDKPVDAIAAALKTGRVQLFGITFDTAKDTIKPESTPTLEALAKAMASGDGRYTIDGHTDSQGADDYNQGLSERRAVAVKAWLVAHGVPEASVGTAGFGESQPLEPNDTPGGRAANRRVEVVVTSG